MGQHGSTGAGRGDDVHLQGVAPGIVIVDGTSAAGVVDQDVDAAEDVRGAGDERLDRRGVADVGDDAEGADAGLTQLGLGLAQSLLAAGAEGDVAALSSEGEADRPADAATAARDDGDLVLESEVQCAASTVILRRMKPISCDGDASILLLAVGTLLPRWAESSPAALRVQRRERFGPVVDVSATRARVQLPPRAALGRRTAGALGLRLQAIDGLD